MATVYQAVMQLQKAGLGNEDIVAWVQNVTGNPKPGPGDEISDDLLRDFPALDDRDIAKIVKVAQGEGFRPDMAQADALDPASGTAGLMSLPPDHSPHPEDGTVGGGKFMSTPTEADVSPPEDVDVYKEGRKPTHTNMVNNPYAPMTGNETHNNVYAPEGPAGAGGQSLQDQSTQALGLLDHGQPQPTAPAPQQNKGLMSQGLDSLKSIGRGMGDYAGKLFDDPNRMALLQGGLSMMDPNSYYDKQGFGSVFTGLNKGLGAAQAGHKGVFDRRQAQATIRATQAQAIKAGRPQDRNVKVVSTSEGAKGFDITAYTEALAAGMSENDARAKAQWTIGGNAGSIKAEAALDRSNKIQGMLSGILSDDKELIDGTTVGPLAGLRLLAEAGSDWSGLGIVKPKATELHDSLDLLKSMLWQDLVGSGQISVSDYAHLEKLLGGTAWLDTPSRVKARLGRVQEFLQGQSKPVGTHNNSSAMAGKESGAVSNTNDPAGIR